MKLKHIDPWINKKTERQLKQFKNAKKDFLYFLAHHASNEDWLNILKNINKKHPLLLDLSLFQKNKTD